MNTIRQKILLAFITVFLLVAAVSCGELTQTTKEGTNRTNPVTTAFVSTNTETSTKPITTATTTVVTQTTDESTTTPQTTLPETTIPTTKTTTTYDGNITLEVTSPNTTSYEVYDELNLNGLEVRYTDTNQTTRFLTSQEYSVEDIDMTTYGTKQVHVTYENYSTFFIIEVNLPTYYANATDKTGQELLLSLRTIINYGFDGVTYGDARYILDETDVDPDNPNNIIRIYTGDSAPGAWSCPSQDNCNWNREHVWPKSALPGSASNGTSNTCSDLHNLKPSEARENSFRGNKYFDNSSTSTSYEPRDEVKGDVARIMLYMAVMYNQLTLTDGTPNRSNYEMGLFSVLLEWNKLDPVDDFERNRNEIIYSYQFNRNPFIDYPDFADLIWE